MPVSRRRRGRAATRAARSGNAPASNQPRKTNKLYLAACIIIAVLVIGSFGLTAVIGGGGGQDGKTRIGSATEYLEGVGSQIPALPNPQHIDEGTQAIYNSVPPTSGDHWRTPADCGFHADPIPDERVVHNMEHSNIVISYNLPLDSDVRVLRDTLDNIEMASDWAVARPYNQIPSGHVALSAWGVLDTFPGVDADRIERFFKAYAGTLGPEGGIIC